MQFYCPLSHTLFIIAVGRHILIIPIIVVILTIFSISYKILNS